MTITDQIKEIIVKNPCVNLSPGEFGFFQADCQFGRLVEQTVTKKKPGLGIGVTIPVTKNFGIGIGTSKSKVKVTQEKVWRKTDCIVLLTNNRFVVQFPQKAVPIDLNLFEGIKINKDAVTIVVEGTEQHFFMKGRDIKRFTEAWNLLGEAARQGVDTADLI